MNDPHDPGADDAWAASPTLDPYLATGSRARRRPLVAIAMVGVLAASAFGVRALTASDGPSSPEAAVHALVDSITKEDVVGAAEALPASERDLLAPAVRDITSEAKRLGVASEDADPAGVQGVDIEVQDLELATQPLGEGVTAVKVTQGTVSGAATLDQLPLGPLLREIITRDFEGDLRGTKRSSDSLKGLNLVAVREGDGWHVSLLYSLVEAIRTDDHQPVPAFGRGVPAKGAQDPEAAARAVVEAFNGRNVARLIELTPLDTMRVLHDYGPAWVAASQKARATSELGRFSDVRLHSEGSGDSRKVVIDHLQYDWGKPADGARVTYGGGCITTTVTYEDQIKPSTSKICNGHIEQDSEGLDPFTDIFALWVPGLGKGELSLTAVQRDGAWYIDPARSIVNVLLDQFRALDRDDVRRFGRFWADVTGETYVPASSWKECGVTPPPEDAPRKSREAAAEACWAKLDGGSSQGPDEPTTVCEDMEDPAAAETCYRKLIAEGRASEEDLRFLQCETVFDQFESEPTDAQEKLAEKQYDDCVAGKVQPPPARPLTPQEQREAVCDRVYDQLPDEPTKQQEAAADERFDQCMAGSAGPPASPPQAPTSEAPTTAPTSTLPIAPSTTGP